MDQQGPRVPVNVHPSHPRQQTDSDALIRKKRTRVDFVNNVDLTQEDTLDQYRLPSCFLQCNFFEGGPSLTIPWAEYLHIEGLEASVRK